MDLLELWKNPSNSGLWRECTCSAHCSALNPMFPTGSFLSVVWLLHDVRLAI